MDNLELFIRLFFSKQGEDKEFVDENIPKFNDPPLCAYVFINLNFGKLFFKVYKFDEKYFAFTNISYIRREVFENYHELMDWLKDICQSNFGKIMCSTGYDENHIPVNNYNEENCPYCKAVYPKKCAKHAALLSWSTSSRNDKYFPEILNISLDLDRTWSIKRARSIDKNISEEDPWLCPIDRGISKIRIRPTRRIELAIQRADGVLSLYRNGKWYSFYNK